MFEFVLAPVKFQLTACSNWLTVHVFRFICFAVFCLPSQYPGICLLVRQMVSVVAPSV